MMNGTFKEHPSERAMGRMHAGRGASGGQMGSSDWGAGGSSYADPAIAAYNRVCVCNECESGDTRFSWIISCLSRC
jgi:hypothetical protein